MDTGSSNTVALAVVTMEAATINKDHAHHPRSNTANNSKINILPTIIPALGKVEVMVVDHLHHMALQAKAGAQVLNNHLPPLLRQVTEVPRKLRTVQVVVVVVVVLVVARTVVEATPVEVPGTAVPRSRQREPDTQGIPQAPGEVVMEQLLNAPVAEDHLMVVVQADHLMVVPQVEVVVAHMEEAGVMGDPPRL
mmetsp:Transcript_31218/g.52790  ORF Transcript_31218/g.52790 Transcript_31218/m.52790 type:complete len:194 (-) Transcript_31218:293-874(-)